MDQNLRRAVDTLVANIEGEKRSAKAELKASLLQLAKAAKEVVEQLDGGVNSPSLAWVTCAFQQAETHLHEVWEANRAIHKMHDVTEALQAERTKGIKDAAATRAGKGGAR